MEAGTPAPALRGVLFLEDFIDVPLPLDSVRERCAQPGSWLTALASAAEEDGEKTSLLIGPTWVGGHVRREVDVTVGPSRERGKAYVVAVAWKATGLAGLFPVLEGDLELAPLGSDRCRLTLAATYVPPFGDLGRALDRALMHRVAQSTVRSFLARLAASLEASDDEERADDPESSRSDGP